MERVFGPRGENPTAFQGGRTHRRPKRDGSAPTINQNEIDVFHAQVKPVARTSESSDFYFRLFGTTVYANTFTLDNFLPSGRFSDVTADKFEKAMRGEEIDFTESFALYGDELIIPTVSGLSLWIHNEGAAVLSLKYSHTLSEETLTFSPKFSPGVSIANNMKMSIAGEIIEAGLKAETKFGASTDIALTGTLTASDNDYGCEVRVEMPIGDVQLVTVSNELFWILQTRHADHDLKQKMKTIDSPATELPLTCAKVLPVLTGVQACVQAKVPKLSGRSIPTFPLSGPGLISLRLSPPSAAKEVVLKFKVTKPGKRS
jgi:hypothetical protein